MTKRTLPKLRITFNAPITLGFCGICLGALILNYLTGGIANAMLFSVYRAPLTDPLSYLRLFCHVFGHAGLSHFSGNIMILLIVGPLLEEKYGAKTMIITIVATAFFTGIIHCLLFGSALLGASGVVFAMILLSSFTGVKEKELPLTFVLVALLYLGNQILSGIFESDNISNLTHIIGGIVGAVVGFSANYNSDKKKRTL